VAQVKGGSLASRILLFLGERWPITTRQVALALATRQDQVERETKRLVAQGLVVAERLGEETYVALSGAGATHVGLPAKEVARLRERRPAPAKPRDEQDPAFG
jgi:predicted ArsR family transcriptional regulator